METETITVVIQSPGPSFGSQMAICLNRTRVGWLHTKTGCVSIYYPRNRFTMAEHDAIVAACENHIGRDLTGICFIAENLYDQCE